MIKWRWFEHCLCKRGVWRSFWTLVWAVLIGWKHNMGGEHNNMAVPDGVSGRSGSKTITLSSSIPVVYFSLSTTKNTL